MGERAPDDGVPSALVAGHPGFTIPVWAWGRWRFRLPRVAIMLLFHVIKRVCFPCSLITAVLVVAASAAPAVPANGDDLFSNGAVPHLQLEISREGERSQASGNVTAC